MAKLRHPLIKWATTPYAEATGGLHTDIFRATILLLESGHTVAEIRSFLQQAAATVQERPVPDREIDSALRYAIGRLGGNHVSLKWPSLSLPYRAEIVSAHADALTRLIESMDGLSQNPADYLSQIYRPDELVCLAMSAHSFLTLPLPFVTAAENLTDAEYINPCPMSKPVGTTQEGTLSAHCLDNVGPKVYQVVEFDFGLPHEHAAILWHLASLMPLFLIVYSGGKSLHGWFNLGTANDDRVVAFFAEAVLLGADPKMWSKCQFARMPCGTNHRTQSQQTVIFFNAQHLLHESRKLP